MIAAGGVAVNVGGVMVGRAILGAPTPLPISRLMPKPFAAAAGCGTGATGAGEEKRSLRSLIPVPGFGADEELSSKSIRERPLAALPANSAGIGFDAVA